MRFSSFNIAIHGIRPEDVADQPEFPDVMAEFFEDFHGAAMIAHNASFDFSVLRASLDFYGLAYPELSYYCSVKLAQRHWPDLPSHRLNSLADHLGLSFEHHNAAEDARVCALATLAMAEEAGVSGIGALAERAGVNPGRLHRVATRPVPLPNERGRCLFFKDRDCVASADEWRLSRAGPGAT